MVNERQKQRYDLEEGLLKKKEIVIQSLTSIFLKTNEI
jgi:hypothetical protein